jgi:putative membrane protein
MITGSYKFAIALLFRDVIRHVSFVTAYVLVISVLDLRYEFQDFHLPASIVAILGTVIGLLLGFRTNSGYARWWEARILWGAIVNDSRTWVRQHSHTRLDTYIAGALDRFSDD